MITAATGIKPTVCGTPTLPMLRTAMRRLKSTRKNTAIIGDRLYTDIRMGHNHNVTPILVLTGEATQPAVRRSPDRPNHIVQALPDIPV